MPNDSLLDASQKALAKWLASYTWDYWFTATSKDKDSCKYPTVALGRASQALRGVARGFVGAETHYLGGWHTHGIFALACDPGEKAGVKCYIERDLSRYGINRIEQARSLDSVTTYLSKYITKEACGEWQLIGRLGWRDRVPGLTSGVY